MGRLERWLDESPPRAPAEYTCLLARDRFWAEDRERLIGTHPDWPDASHLLGVHEEIGHSLVLVLSRLPTSERASLATAFLRDERLRRAADDDVDPANAWFRYDHGVPGDHRSVLAIGAALALQVLDLTERHELRSESVADLLRGAAQGDDLTITPWPALQRLHETVARIRSDPAMTDDADPHGVASVAVIEVLDPSSGRVSVPEILARAAFATVECRSRAETLAFLLAADRILAGVGVPD